MRPAGRSTTKRFMGLASSGTAHDSAIFFLGNLANTTLSFLAVLILSRHLGPAGFGILAVFNSVLVMIVGLTDLGLNTTSIRLVSEYRQEDPRKAAVTMNVIVRLELMVGTLILLVGVMFSAPLARLLGGEQYLLPVRLGFIAGAFTSVAAFFGPFFVAYRQYIKNALLNLASFLLRTGLVILMLVMAKLTITRVMDIYTLVPMLFLIVGFWFIPRDFLTRTSPSERRRAYGDVIRYSKWIFLTLVATGAISRLDVLFLAHYWGARPTGWYYAAQQLITIMPLVITALSTVLLQRISSLPRAQYVPYLKRAAGAIGLIAIALLPGLLLAPYVIKLIFGGAYAPAVAPFRILLLAQLVTLLAVPLSVWFLGTGRPVKTTIAAGLQFVTALVFYLLLIPRYGTVGAADAVLISSFVGMGALVGLAYQDGSRVRA